MINYVILVSNEYLELEALLKNLLSNNIDYRDIIIIVDSNNTNDKVKEIIQNYNVSSYTNPLNNDFSQQRNFAKSKCWHKYIFYLDADEVPNYLLIKNLPDIIQQNTNIDIFGIPRLNYLDNDTDLDEIPAWVSQPADQLSRIAWPDFQYRLMKNLPNIIWVNKVHEVPIGGSIAQLQPVVQNCLVHIKTVSGQMRRQKYYEHISSGTGV